MKNEDNFTNDEVIEFIKCNLDKLPVSYLLLTPFEAEKYDTRLAYDEKGRLKLNLGLFYKPISNILNE